MKKKKKKEKKIKVAGFLKQNPPQTIPQTKNKLYHRVPSQRKRSMSKKHPSKRVSTWPYPRKLAKSSLWKVTPTYMYLCIYARAGGKEEAGQTSSAPPSRIRGNRFAIKSPLNKRETRVLETWARKIISNVHLRVHTCVATMYARSGRVQPVNQRMSRKPTGQTGGCVIRACAHQPRFCVCVRARRLDEDRT